MSPPRPPPRGTSERTVPPEDGVVARTKNTARAAHGVPTRPTYDRTAHRIASARAAEAEYAERETARAAAHVCAEATRYLRGGVGARATRQASERRGHRPDGAPENAARSMQDASREAEGADFRRRQRVSKRRGARGRQMREDVSARKAGARRQPEQMPPTTKYAWTRAEAQSQGTSSGDDVTAIASASAISWAECMFARVRRSDSMYGAWALQSASESGARGRCWAAPARAGVVMSSAKHRMALPRTAREFTLRIGWAEGTLSERAAPAAPRCTGKDACEEGQAANLTRIDSACHGVRERGGEDGQVEQDSKERRLGPAQECREPAFGYWRAGAGRWRGELGGSRQSLRLHPAAKGRGHARGWDRAVKCVDRVNVASVLGLDAKLQSRFHARRTGNVYAIMGTALALVEELSVTCDTERVLGLLFDIELVVRGRDVAGLAVETSGCQGPRDNRRRFGRGEADASAVFSPELVQIDRVAQPPFRVCRGRGLLRRWAIARFPAVAGEAEQRVGLRQVGLFDVLEVLVARVGI
eukprot:649646-Pleurochrysis_carterae.AAC.2